MGRSVAELVLLVVPVCHGGIGWLSNILGHDLESARPAPNR